MGIDIDCNIIGVAVRIVDLQKIELLMLECYIQKCAHSLAPLTYTYIQRKRPFGWHSALADLKHFTEFSGAISLGSQIFE